MSAPVPNRTLPRAHPRAGSGNPARRVDRRSYASCVVSGHRKCRESQHQTRVTITRTAIGFDRGQQFSITAMTNGGGSVVERYAYSAYGTPTITDGAGVVQAVSSEGNRYLYTGREWDEGLSLYHYRARMHDSVSGRFCSRDPIGYVDGQNLYEGYFAPGGLDPLGLSVIEDTYNFFASLIPCGSISITWRISITSAGVPPPKWLMKKLGVNVPPPGGVGGGTPCPPCTKCCITSITTVNKTVTLRFFYSLRFRPDIPVAVTTATSTTISTGSCVAKNKPCPPVAPRVTNLPPSDIDTGRDLRDLKALLQRIRRAQR